MIREGRTEWRGKGGKSKVFTEEEVTVAKALFLLAAGVLFVVLATVLAVDLAVDLALLLFPSFPLHSVLPSLIMSLSDVRGTPNASAH